MDDMDDLAKLAEEECYSDVVKLLHHTVHLFVGHYGLGDGYQELFSIANELWVKAHRTHSDGRGKYSKRIRYVVWNGLLDHARKRAWRTRLCRKWDVDFQYHDKALHEFEERIKDRFNSDTLEVLTTKLENALYAQYRSELYMPLLLDNLSDDAKGVVRLVVDPPAEPPKGRTVAQWRRSLRRALLEMGWTTARIAEAFSEIGRAIG